MAVSSFVESVEFIEYTLGATSLSGSVTLSGSQDLSNCVPFMTAHGGSNNQDSHMLDIYFESTATVVFKRATQRSNALTIRAYVVEFNPEEVRVQQGEFDVNDQTTDTVTLPTTLSGIDRAAMTHFWWSSSTSTSWQYHNVRGRVVSTSTIDFYRYSTGASSRGHWYLFEDLNDNFRVKHHSHSHSSTGETTIVHADRHCVDPLRMFIIGSYTTNYNSYRPDTGTTRIFLYSDGSVRSDRSSGSYDIYWAYQVFEFLDTEKIYTPFVHHLLSISSSSTSTTQTYGGNPNRVPFVCNPETTTIVCAMPQGVSRLDTSANVANQAFISVKLNSNDGVYLQRYSSNYAVYPSYIMAVDWAGIAVDTGSNTALIPEGTGVGHSFVKSVENFRITCDEHFSARVLTKGQDWENCAIFASHSSTSGNNLRDQLANVTIVSPGIVCTKRWSTTGDARVDISVVEFWPNQVKVQHKNTYVSGQTTTNLPIEEVSDINKCFILSKTFTSGNYASVYSLVRVRFTSTNNVEFYKDHTGSEVDTSIFIVEDLKNNFVTRHFTGSSSRYLSFYNEDYLWGSHNSFLISSYTTNYNSYRPDYTYIYSKLIHDFRAYSYKAAASYTYYVSVTFVKFMDDRRHIQYFELNQTASTKIDTYDNVFEESDGLTCFNNVQSSTMACATSANTLSEAIGTVRITDYDNKTIEMSKAASNYNSQGHFTLIDWVGYHYQDANNIKKATPTKSFVRSLQKTLNYSTSGFIEAYLDKGQNIKQCVPFINKSANFNNADALKFAHAIYRREDPECFNIRLYPGAGNRFTHLYIVEFNDNVKIQYGYGFSNGTNRIFSIDKVDLNRAFLVFYAWSDSWADGPANGMVAGYFNSDEEIEFNRNASNESMYISWYIVECINNSKYWQVDHAHDTTWYSGASADIHLHISPDFGRSLILASYNHNYASYRSDYGSYRIYNLQDNRVRFDRSASSYSIYNLSTEVVEMSTEIANKGFSSTFYFVSLNGATTSGVYDIKLKEQVAVDRSMLINANLTGQSRADSSANGYADEGYHYYWFKDDTHFVARKTGNASYNTYSVAYLYQWPDYNKYYIEGYTKEKGVPVQRTVALHRSSTNEMVDSTISTSGTGYFLLETPYGEKHYAVCLDDESKPDYNHLIYGKLDPTVISGSFAYMEGLTETEGFDIGVPLCYQDNN